MRNSPHQKIITFKLVKPVKYEKSFPFLFLLIFIKNYSVGQFYVKNLCNCTAYVAVCYLSDAKNGEWTTTGWFKFHPGEFEAVTPGPLQGRYVYYYAHSDDNNYTWEGKLDLCVEDDKFWHIQLKDAEQEFSCPKVEKFKEVDTKGELSYHCNLRCSDNEWVKPQADEPRFPVYHNDPSPSTPKDNRSSNQGGGNSGNTRSDIAFDHVFVSDEITTCPTMDCNYTSVYFVHNQHNYRAIFVKYEHLNWNGVHISTQSIKVEAQDKVKVGTNEDFDQYRILSASYAD